MLHRDVRVVYRQSDKSSLDTIVFKVLDLLRDAQRAKPELNAWVGFSESLQDIDENSVEPTVCGCDGPYHQAADFTAACLRCQDSPRSRR